MQTAMNCNKLWYTAFVCDHLVIPRYTTQSERLTAQCKIYVFQCLTDKLVRQPFSFRYGIISPFSQSLNDTIEEVLGQRTECPEYYVNEVLHVLYPYFRPLHDIEQTVHANRNLMRRHEWWALLAYVFYKLEHKQDPHERASFNNDVIDFTKEQIDYAMAIRDELIGMEPAPVPYWKTTADETSISFPGASLNVTKTRITMFVHEESEVTIKTYPVDRKQPKSMVQLDALGKLLYYVRDLFLKEDTNPKDKEKYEKTMESIQQFMTYYTASN